MMKRVSRYICAYRTHLTEITVLVSLLCLLGGCAAEAPEQDQPVSITDLLPAEGIVKSWNPAGQTEQAEGDDLFLLINGGAEVYHEYGFRQAALQQYKNSDGKGINVEIYEMESPEAAYGMFSFKQGRTGREAGIGQESSLEDYYLNFRKGSLVVTLIGFDSEPDTMAGIVDLGRAMADRIASTAPKPELATLIPPVNGREPRLTYILGTLGLVNRCDFLQKNIFGFKEGVVADYGDFQLYLFRYDDPAAVEKQWPVIESELGLLFVEGFRQTDDLLTVILTDNRIMTLEKIGQQILMIVRSPDLEVTESMDGLKSRIQ